MEEQITLDSWLNLVNKPKPKYAKGDIVYYVKVDRVHKCSVKQTFEVKKHFSDGFDDYRHNLLELDTNNNFQTGEKDFGATLFDDYESAKKMADNNNQDEPNYATLDYFYNHYFKNNYAIN